MACKHQKMKAMKQCKWLAFTVVAAFIITACSGGKSASDQVELRLRPEQGKTYAVAMEVNSESKVMGMNTKTVMNMEISMTADEVSDEEVIMSSTYDRMAMNMETPMGNMKYDSDDPEGASGMMGDMLKPVFDKLLEANLKITFNELGEVVSSSGMEGLFEGMAGMESMGDQMNAADQMGAATAVFPEEAVGVGDSWEKEIVNTTSAPMVMKAVYTVEDITADEVILKVTGDISTYEGEDAGAAAAQIEEVTGDFTGDLVVDRASGWTKSANLTQNMQMKMTQQGMPLTVDAVNTITMTSK